MPDDKPNTPTAPEQSGSEQPHDDSDRRERFSNQIIGWAFVASAVLLLGFIGYFVFVVTDVLIQPTPVFEALSQNYLDKLTDKPPADKVVGEAKTTSKSPKADQDRNTVNLIVILEYANADIRTASVQVAFALVGGLFFATLGILMFAAGSVGDVNIGGKTKGIEFRFVTAAPGLVTIVLGGAIIAFGVTKDVSRPLRAEVFDPYQINIESKRVNLDSGGVAEEDGNHKTPKH